MDFPIHDATPPDKLTNRVAVKINKVWIHGVLKKEIRSLLPSGMPVYLCPFFLPRRTAVSSIAIERAEKGKIRQGNNFWLK